MKEVYKKITVDLSRKSNVRLIFARQNDLGSRNLLIMLTDGGSKYMPASGSTAALNFKRSDDLRGAIAGTIMNTGEVLVELTQIVLGVPGETVCSVSVFDKDANKLTSSDFCLDVGEEFYSGDTIDQEPDYSLLQSVFGEMARYTAAESERVRAEAKREANEIQRSLAETGREMARVTFEEKVDAKLEQQDARISSWRGDSGIVTLVSSKWKATREQTVTLPDLSEDDLVIFYPATADDREYCGYYGVFVSPESYGNSFIATARAIPAGDISLRYYVIRGSLPEIEEVE